MIWRDEGGGGAPAIFISKCLSLPRQQPASTARPVSEQCSSKWLQASFQATLIEQKQVVPTEPAQTAAL